MKIREIKELISSYGGEKTLNELLEAELSKTPYLCPKCNGEGYNKVGYNAYPKGLPDSGFVENWKYKNVECDLCKGKGYTEREYKPKMVQEGWE